MHEHDHGIIVGHFEGEDVLGGIFGDRRGCVDRGERSGRLVAAVVGEDGRRIGLHGGAAASCGLLIAERITEAESGDESEACESAPRQARVEHAVVALSDCLAMAGDRMRGDFLTRAGEFAFGLTICSRDSTSRSDVQVDEYINMQCIELLPKFVFVRTAPEELINSKVFRLIIISRKTIHNRPAAGLQQQLDYCMDDQR